MRHFLRRVRWAGALILLGASTAFAQHHGHGHGVHNHGRWGPGWGWGGGGFGYPGYGFSYGSFGGLAFGRVAIGGYWPFNYGYSSFGGVGSYALPAGGFGPYYGNSSLFGYPNFGPYYNYVPMTATTAPFIPPLVQQPPAIPILPGNPTIEELARQQNPPGNANFQPRQSDVAVFVKPSTAEAKRKSIHYQAQGDEWFLKQNYLQAFARYKQAYAAAPDRPEPRFRMALALAGTTNYGLAVDELKRLSQLDPQWPTRGERLDEVFGGDRMIAKNIVMQKVAEWVKEDVRDPDRLYLLGVLLHFNEDTDKARLLFETAALLSGDPPHVHIFLEPWQQPAAAQPVRPVDDTVPVPRPQAGAEGPRRDEAVDPAPRIAGARSSPLDRSLRAEPDAR